MEFKGHQNKGDKIIALNKELKKLASTENLQFINLYSHFVDKEGKLPLDYTHDGLHLNGAAYIKWAEFIKSEGFLND
jgi:lysophospholipase L1-like esterase